MKLVKNVSIAVASAGCVVLAGGAQAFAQSVTLQYDSQIGRPANLAQGEFPGAPGTLAVPQGVAVQESTGDVFVANARGVDRVEVFDSQGNYIKGIGGTGSGPGQFDEPAALAFEPGTGNLYAGDVFNNRVNVFDGDGNYIKSIAQGQFGGLIEGRPFFGPSQITFDKDGVGYVGDYTGDRILKFNSNGDIVGTIGGTTGSAPGQFQGPSGIGITSDGNIVVADQLNNRLQVLNPQGEPIKIIGEQGTGSGQFNQPIDVKVDSKDNIFVTDSINSRVQVFDKDGKFLTAFGEPARDANGNVVPPVALGAPSPYGDPLDLTPGRFNWTSGAAIQGDKYYVNDFFQGRVQVLDVNYKEGDKGSTEVPEPSTLLGLTVLGIGAGAVRLKKYLQQKQSFNSAS